MRETDAAFALWALLLSIAGALGSATVLADAEHAEGKLGLLEIVSRKGLEPPRHFHHREDETFYIGDETYGAGPGMFVFAPRDVPTHSRSRPT